MMMGNMDEEASNRETSSDEIVEGEDGELNRLEVRNGKKVFTMPRHDPIKNDTKGEKKTDKECFRCGRVGHIRADCRAKTHLDGGPPKPAPKKKGVGSCEEETPHTDEDCEESSFFDCWDEQSDVLQQAEPWARNAPKSISSAERCTSVKLPVCSVSQKLGVYSQQLPTTAPKYDISSEGENRPDPPPIDNSHDEEW